MGKILKELFEKLLQLLGLKPSPPSKDDEPFIIPSMRDKMPKGHVRHLEPKLEKILDDHIIARFGDEFKVAIKSQSAADVSVMALKVLGDLDVREFPKNSNKGELVELLQETIGTAEQEPWCMATQQSVVAYTELKMGRPSALFASEHCMTTWRTSPRSMRVELADVKPGDIIIWNYPPTDSGHTGGVIEVPAVRSWLRLVEGNTDSGLNPDGSIIREGGGVYITKRTTASSNSMRLMGFLRPF